MKKLLIILLLFPIFLNGQNLLTNSAGEALSFGTLALSTAGRLPSYFTDYFALWIDASESTSEYYIDKIGVQDRNALSQGGISGINQVGKAIVFDSDKVQYSRTVENRPANFRLINNSLTLSFWIKMDTIQASLYTIVFGSLSITDGYMYSIINQITGKFTFVLRDSNGDIIINSDNNVADDEWHHVFLSLNKTGNVAMYIDNVIQASPVSMIGSTFDDLDIPWTIGVNATSNAGTLYMRDFRLFSTAITSESDRLKLYNKEYVSGATSWWMMEDYKDGDLYMIKDCIDTVDLTNINFDNASITKGAWPSLFNKFGYRATEYSSPDAFQGDGDFLDDTEWTFSRFLGRWTFLNDGAVTWNAADNVSPYIRNNRTIDYLENDIYKLSFNITAGVANFSINEAPGNVPIYTAADYAVGSHEVIFKMTLDGTNIQLVTSVASGVWTMENLVLEKYDAPYISPLMTSSEPTTDIYNELLVFKNLAKNNLFKSNDSVYFTDSIAEIFEATNLISVNNWFDTTGVSNKIKWTDIETQTSRQYFNGSELIIIKSDVELTQAEDLIIKKYLNLPTD